MTNPVVENILDMIIEIFHQIYLEMRVKIVQLRKYAVASIDN